MFGRKKDIKTRLFDGAIGTTLLMPDEILKFAPDELNEKQPERVAAMHWTYLEAGAEIITSNTFMSPSMNRPDLFRLGVKIAKEAIDLFEKERIDKDGQFKREMLSPDEVEKEAIEVAKAAQGKDSFLGKIRANKQEEAEKTDNYTRPLVAASIGPCNDPEVCAKCIEIAAEEAANYIVMESVSGLDQARIMVAGYADYFGYKCAEDLPEDADANLKACQECEEEGSGLPLILLFTTGDDGRLLDGTTTQEAVEFIKKEIIPMAPMFAAGLNCSYGPAVLVPAMKAFLKEDAFYKVAMPSADLYGDFLPPDIFVKHLLPLIKDRIDFIGGCCNSTPAHTLELRKAIDELQGGK